MRFLVGYRMHDAAREKYGICWKGGISWILGEDASENDKPWDYVLYCAVL